MLMYVRTCRRPFLASFSNALLRETDRLLRDTVVTTKKTFLGIEEEENTFCGGVFCTTGTTTGSLQQ